MAKKGPSKNSTTTTTISFYVDQYRYLKEKQLKLAKPSLADLVREMVDEMMRADGKRVGKRVA